MGIPWDDVVLIQQGNKPGDPSVITVNCPDKAGLGCDLCRIVVDYGLSITKGGLFFKKNLKILNPFIFIFIFSIYLPMFFFL